MSTLSTEGLEAVLGSTGVEGAVPIFAGADLKRDPMSIFVSYLAATLAQLTRSEPDLAFGAIQWPNDEGDLVIVLPKLRLKNVNAEVLASELMPKFPASPLYAHPFNEGHTLRFFLDPGTLARVLLPYIIERGTYYGKAQLDAVPEPGAPRTQRGKVVVEFSSPNLGQEFSSDHLRSTIVGAFTGSIYESMGWDVFKINFLGDWGKHIGLLAVGWAKFHSDDLFNKDPLRHLLDIYAKIEALFKAEREVVKVGPKNDCLQAPTEPITQDRDAFFKQMEDGEPDVLALWNTFRESCVSMYTDLYARLGIKFDEYSGESKARSETAVEVETILREKGVAREEDGVWSIDFGSNGYKGLGSPKIRYRNGTTTYLLRDIATALERHRTHSFEKMIYVVTGKQDAHFHQMTAGLELMGYSDLASKLQHINFGRVHGLTPDLGSSGLLLGDILDQCQKAVCTFLETDRGDLYTIHGEEALMIANSLAGCALMTQGLSVKRGANFGFDLNDMATLNPYNGLSLQSWLSKISLKLKGIMIPSQALGSLDYSIFEQDEYEPFADVLRLLVQFPGTVKNSFRTLESSYILTLLFRVTDLLPDVWAADTDNQIKDMEEAEADHAGPSHMVGAKPVNHVDAAKAKQKLGDGVAGSSLVKDPLQTGEWVVDDRLPKTEIEGGHSEALEHSKSPTNTLKDDDDYQQLGRSHQEIDEKAETQADGPMEKLGVEGPLDVELHDENPQAVRHDQPAAGWGNWRSSTPSPRGDHDSSKDEECREDCGLENEKHKICGTRDDDSPQQGITLDSAGGANCNQDKILGIEQRPLLQDSKHQGSQHEPLSSCNIQARQRQNSGILLGEEGIQQEAIKNEDNSENTATNEATGIEEQLTQEEAREQDSDISPKGEEGQEQEGCEPISTPLTSQAGEELNRHAEKSSEEEPLGKVENSLQEEAGENVRLEKTLTIGEEDLGKGKGKARADQADDELRIPPERLAKLAFYECVRQVLENGMRMVGIVPVDI